MDNKYIHEGQRAKRTNLFVSDIVREEVRRTITGLLDTYTITLERNVLDFSSTEII